MKILRKIIKKAKIFRFIKILFLKINSGNNIYIKIDKYRSLSENGIYSSAVIKALKNQRTFNNFKRSKRYRVVLEHATKDWGAEYLNILKSRNDGILEKALKTVLLSDYVGNPIKFKYDGFREALSPSTLRYVKITSDLINLFGNDLGSVAEIGCGYGGQALINDQLLNVKFTKLFDLPYVNQLVERYLNSYILKGGYQTSLLNKESPNNYDLVLSNYAFSEFPKELQLAYIKKVISNSTKGYMIMNSGNGSKMLDNQLTLNELKNLLPKFQIFEEEPLTSEYNYLIVWGFNQNYPKDYFKIKKVN